MNAQLLQRIQDVLNADDLSTWEQDFLESLETQVRAGKELTDKQADKLRDIEEEAKP